MERNMTTSPLYRLPDELVLGICSDSLEGSDIYIARQTCSLLRRILSSTEFVCQVKRNSRYFTFENPTLDIPKIGVEWDDVQERLRRRRCCSACIDARVPKRDGSASDYDATMPRLASETKFCNACNAPHPLIMFSHKQRSLGSSAVCIMEEGSVAMCPHYRVSLKALEIHRRATQSSDGNQEPHPWALHCKDCFRDTKESDPSQPSAKYVTLGNYISSSTRKGTLFLDWIMPFQEPLGTVATNNSQPSQHSTDTPTVSKTIRDALVVAAKTYNPLLCPHVSFDEISPPQAYRWKRAVRMTVGWNQEQGLENNTVTIRAEQPGHGCRVCQSLCFHYMISYGPAPLQERQWILSRNRVYLSQKCQLPVPDLLGDQFSLDHRSWRQMLHPPSYGLTADLELRHLTWCPDSQCANGRNWAPHLRHLDVVANHFAIETTREWSPSLPWKALCTPAILEREIDNETVCWMGVLQNIHKPHRYRGLEFLPAAKR